MLHMFSVSAQTWQSSNEQRKLRHVGTVHKSCDGCQKSTTGYMATLNPFETTAAIREWLGSAAIWPCFLLDLSRDKRPNYSHTPATAVQLHYPTWMYPFLSFKNQFGLWFHRRTAEKKNDGEFADVHLGCVEITYHFSHHIFRTKVAINLDSNSPSSVCGTSAPAAPDRTMTLYVYTYICVSGYQQIYIQMSICICIYIYILGCISNSFSLGRPRV